MAETLVRFLPLFQINKHTHLHCVSACFLSPAQRALWAVHSTCLQMVAWAGFLCQEAATCLPGGSGQRCSPRHGWVRVAAPSFCVGAPCSSQRPLTEFRTVCPAPAQLLCPLQQRVQTDTLHSQVLESPGCCPSLSVLLLAPAFFPPCPPTSSCCGRPNSLDLLSLGQEKGQSAGEGLPRRPGKLLAMAQGTTPPL